MKFMVMVKGSRESEAGQLPDEQMLASMAAFNEQMVKAGVMLGGEGLRPSSEGFRVRLANGRFTVTDGPFSEAKEVVAGFWIIRTGSREEAIDWLKRAPFQEGDVDIHEMYDGPEPPLAARDETKKRFFSIYFPPSVPTAGPTQAEIERMGAHIQQKVDAGELIGTGGLNMGSKPARITYNGSTRTVTDGPFAEAKEVIGGFGMLQTGSREQVIDLVKEFLTVAGGGMCEVRAPFELSDFPQGEAIEHHRRLQSGMTKR